MTAPKGQNIMKKKITAVFLALLMLAALLCGCSGNIKHKNYNTGVFTDSSVYQQRWLRDPETDLVLNPEGYINGTPASDNRLSLNVGYLNADKEVSTVINDSLFLLESSSANAKVGEVYFEGVWDQNDPECNLKYSAEKVVADTSTPGRIAIDSFATDTQVIQFKSTIPFRWDVDLLVVMEVASVSTDAQWGLQASLIGTSRTGVTLSADDTVDTGRFVFNLSDIAKAHVKNADEHPELEFNMMLRISSAAESELLPRIVLTSYKILAVPKTLTYANDKVSTTWAPHAITSELAFPNGSAAKTTDFFAVDATDKENVFKNVVARQITYTGQGILFLGGKTEGKVQFDDTKIWIMVDGDGYNFVVAPKKKQGLEFFASEEDMLNRRNGTETPDGNTKYWSVPLGTYTVGDSIFAAVAFGTDADDFETLGEKAKAVVSSTKAVKYYNRAVAYWDWYLKRVDELPNEFINYEGPVVTK